ncbi:hypothetical protein L596_030144 [Steinernema carpocapsae]|uniref:Uncharacterized protein n=1 Tax=Steinernema carpocapsae TaxID=34508 RepID=A0A4V5ZXG9_STECR|nr:hypothetical protein L596_030144 [Steinernema carpocapsae]
MPPKKAPRKKKASPPCEDSEKPPKRQKSLTTKAKTEELCLTAVVIALDQQDHLVKDPSFNGKSAKEANIAVAEAIVGREVYNVNSKYRFVVIPCHEDSETNSFAKEFHAPSPDLVRYVSVQLPTLTDFTEDVSHYIKVAINTLAKEISNLPDHIKAKEVSIILLRGGRRPNVVFTLEGEAQQDVLAIMKEKLGPDSQFTFIGAVPHYDEELHPEGVRKNDHGSLYEGLSYENAYQNASTFNTHTVNPRSYSHTFTIGGNFNDGNPKLCSFEVQAIAIRSKFKLDLKRRYTDAQGKEVVRISRITKGVLKSDFDLAGEDEADDQDNPESSDAKEVKQDIEKVAAYKYGSELIPVYKQDEDDMYPEEDKHLNLLYFAKVSDIKPHCSIRHPAE